MSTPTQTITLKSANKSSRVTIDKIGIDKFELAVTTKLNSSNEYAAPTRVRNGYTSAQDALQDAIYRFTKDGSTIQDATNEISDLLTTKEVSSIVGLASISEC
ncbi:hypothetical protein [Sulfurimonas sp. HSL-1716]|uniref:hypothetical protein n=1 Tax=Hydrocurvibacter sulfurireducens TaxID=3131937 RepID=UPI0031F89860